MERHTWKDIVPMDRYRVYAAGVLHDYDRKILTMLYQPLIGSKAAALYTTFWSGLEQEEEEHAHHSLMLDTCMSLPEIYEERRKLEAIGLLRVYVKRMEEGRSFLYELHPPLSPRQFFDDIVLTIFLYNRLGKTKYNKLKQFFLKPDVQRSDYEEITHSFNDVFQPFTPSQAAHLQNELATPEGFIVTEKTEGNEPDVFNENFDFALFLEGVSSFVSKKALTEQVREYILKIAYVYGINPLAMQSIVLGALSEQGTVDIERLRKGARDWYRFENGSALPVFSERVQPMNARTMQSKEPSSQEELLVQQLEQISPRELLKEIAGGAEPTAADLKIVEGVMTRQKLLPGVVNVLIHYVMLRTDMKLSKAYVEKIAAHWARKKIRTVAEAMRIAKEEHRQYQQWATGGSTKSVKRASRKELIPEWLEQKKETEHAGEQPKEERTDVEEKRRQLEQALQQYKKDRQ